MILAQLKDYLLQHKTATVFELAQHVKVQPSAISGMLDIWIRKGKVGKATCASSCASQCVKCNSWNDVYQWLEPLLRTKT